MTSHLALSCLMFIWSGWERLQLNRVHFFLKHLCWLGKTVTNIPLLHSIAWGSPEIWEKAAGILPCLTELFPFLLSLLGLHAAPLHRCGLLNCEVVLALLNRTLKDPSECICMVRKLLGNYLLQQVALNLSSVWQMSIIFWNCSQLDRTGGFCSCLLWG